MISVCDCTGEVLVGAAMERPTIRLFQLGQGLASVHAVHFVAAISYRYSTNDLTAPSMPCTFGFFESIT
jgi:hypothetical protein